MSVVVWSEQFLLGSNLSDITSHASEQPIGMDGTRQANLFQVVELLDKRKSA